MARSSSAQVKKKREKRAPAAVTPTLDNPLIEGGHEPGTSKSPPGLYERSIAQGEELRRRPYTAAGTLQRLGQHAKNRMTVWERIDVLQDANSQPTILYQNWGRNLDGASIVT